MHICLTLTYKFILSFQDSIIKSKQSAALCSYHIWVVHALFHLLCTITSGDGYSCYVSGTYGESEAREIMFLLKVTKQVRVALDFLIILVAEGDPPVPSCSLC